MSENELTRSELIDLVRRIQDAQDLGANYEELIALFRARVSCPNVEELLEGDYSADYIVDFVLKWRPTWPKLSYEELVDLVTKIINSEGSQADLAMMIKTFDENCRHPAKNGLIFYPGEYFDGNPDPSAKQIAEKALTGE